MPRYQLFQNLSSIFFLTTSFFFYILSTMKPLAKVNMWLERTGLPPYRLADMADIARSTFYNFVKGKGSLTVDQWERVRKIIEKAA